MNSTNTYTFSKFSGLLQHGTSSVKFVRDGEGNIDSCEILPVDVHARSGDYFVTLAMRLDILARKTENMEVKHAIEDMVSDLIYLQDNYVISKNKQLQ